MGLSKKLQVEGGLVGLVRALKPINTKSRGKESQDDDDGGGDEGSCCTTPTAKESRIPKILPCPPAPRRKPRTTPGCNFYDNRVFFTPPDLDKVFRIHVEKANWVKKEKIRVESSSWPRRTKN